MAGLANKVALITGGAKGIGYACAQALGRAGAKVLLADVDTAALTKAEQELRGEGIAASTAVCDVGDKAQVEAAVAAAVSAFGSLDVAVCNAGIVRAAGFLEMSEEDFDAVIRVNLKGIFLTGQAAARQMVAQGRGGAIVTMSSVNGLTAIPSICGYNASKGGVNNLTRCMALALAPHKIRVNAVGPGSIRTDVLASVVSDKAAMDKVLSRTPMLRVAEPIEVGNVVKFLCSDDASYMTGQVVYVDGGRLALNYTVPVPEQEEQS
ncbi:hypothetical protein ABPG75_000579 [Micractinium tetrahymenae]